MIFNSSINLSLVAFYGDKPVELSSLINKLQKRIVNHELIQNKFIPYQLEQVHGTIIGCEGLVTDSGIISKWFYEQRQETKQIDFPGLINYLQHQINFPITIRFGGYNPQQEYNFLSREQHLSLRSLQLQPANNQTIPIVIGWSWKNNGVSREIDKLRRNLQQFNLLHKYHSNPDAIDNDFYLRLGTITKKLTLDEENAIAADLRNLLSTQAPLYIPINLNNITFVQYQDLLLPPATTKVIPISQFQSANLDGV